MDIRILNCEFVALFYKDCKILKIVYFCEKFEEYYD